jgi:FHS family glucose/mannose:H+ symporter-like MFS transporter
LSRKTPLYVGFAATGVALTLPGALLPVLLRRWSLGDARGGALLGCFFVGSTLGTLCARGRMHRALAAGAVAVALGALGLAAAGSLTAFAAIALYGAGLGLTIPATALLVSQRFPADRRVEMVRLNLVWSMGAVCGPWVALHSAHTGRMFVEVAGCFAALAAWGWWGEGDGAATIAAARVTPVDKVSAGFENDELQGNRGGTVGLRWAWSQVPWPLLLLLFCDTGVEASTNGWLTSYAQRTGDALGITIGAGTLLWAGVLVSRGVHATRWAARLPERMLLGASTVAMAGALGLLVAWPAGRATLVAAAVLGLAAGPVYPVVLSLALRWKEDAGVFVVGGLGSAALPLATGAVSAGMHSLRWGLGVPLAAAAAMVALVVGAGKTVTSDK